MPYAEGATASARLKRRQGCGISQVQKRRRKFPRGSLRLFSYPKNQHIQPLAESTIYREEQQNNAGMQAHTTLRCPCGGRGQHGGLWRLGNAHSVSHRHCGGTPVYPACMQLIRRIPHGPAADPGAGAGGLLTACAHQQRDGPGPEQGPVLHHPQRKRRGCGRRLSVQIRGGLVPAGGERRQ